MFPYDIIVDIFSEVDQLGGGGDGRRLDILPKEGVEAEATSLHLHQDVGLQTVQMVVFYLRICFPEPAGELDDIFDVVTTGSRGSHHLLSHGLCVGRTEPIL